MQQPHFLWREKFEECRLLCEELCEMSSALCRSSLRDAEVDLDYFSSVPQEAGGATVEVLVVCECLFGDLLWRQGYQGTHTRGVADTST